MTEFILITGFLGSGKTTLLKHLLDINTDDKRIAIIQNEFAPTSADGKELKHTGHDFELVEINNGSVFCVCMLSNFIHALKKTIDNYQPDLIVLEASGLSDPVNIIDLLQSDEFKHEIYLSKIITIVDALNFDKGFHSLPRFRHQIMIADSIVINKTDLLTGDIGYINDKIKTLNPYAVVMSTTYCKVGTGMFVSGNHEHAAAQRFIGTPSEGRPDINAYVLRIHDKITHDGLKMFIFDLKKNCFRIKGYVNLVDGEVIAVQSVYEDLRLEKIEGYRGPTELIAFGKGLTVRDLRNKFKQYCLG